MALDKLVDSAQLDSDLTSVANAIRTKGGTSASLSFPQGFVDAVDAISGGGGASLHMHTGSFTPAENAQSMVVSGLDAPALLVRIFIDDYDNVATDGTPKILGACYADGVRVLWRTNSAGTAASVGDNGEATMFSTGRTVYADGTIVANRFVSTNTGFTYNTGHASYNFKAGYTYRYVCYTLPDSEVL